MNRIYSMGSQASTDYQNNTTWNIEVNGTYREIQYPICDFIECAYQEYLCNPNNAGVIIEGENYLDFRSMTLNESLKIQRVISH